VKTLLRIITLLNFQTLLFIFFVCASLALRHVYKLPSKSAMNQQHSTVNLTLARVTQAVFASSAVWPKISANAADIQETNLEQLHSSAQCILTCTRNADININPCVVNRIYKLLLTKIISLAFVLLLIMMRFLLRQL
jgi:hypothetical protein